MKRIFSMALAAALLAGCIATNLEPGVTAYLYAWSDRETPIATFETHDATDDPAVLRDLLQGAVLGNELLLENPDLDTRSATPYLLEVCEGDICQYSVLFPAFFSQNARGKLGGFAAINELTTAFYFEVMDRPRGEVKFYLDQLATQVVNGEAAGFEDDLVDYRDVATLDYQGFHSDKFAGNLYDSTLVERAVAAIAAGYRPSVSMLMAGDDGSEVEEDTPPAEDDTPPAEDETPPSGDDTPPPQDSGGTPDPGQEGDDEVCTVVEYPENPNFDGGTGYGYDCPNSRIYHPYQCQFESEDDIRCDSYTVDASNCSAVSSSGPAFCYMGPDSPNPAEYCVTGPSSGESSGYVGGVRIAYYCPDGEEYGRFDCDIVGAFLSCGGYPIAERAVEGQYSSDCVGIEAWDNSVYTCRNGLAYAPEQCSSSGGGSYSCNGDITF